MFLYITNRRKYELSNLEYSYKLHLQSRQIIRSQGDWRSRDPYWHRTKQLVRVCQTLHNTPQAGRWFQGIQVLCRWQMPQDCDSQQQPNDRTNNHQHSTRLKLWLISNTLLWWKRVVLRSCPFFCASPIAVFLSPLDQGLFFYLDRTDKQAILSFGRRFAKLLACPREGTRDSR